MPRLHVVLFCKDKTAMIYHAETGEDLIQSFVDFRRFVDRYVSAIGVSDGQHQLSGTFVARALVAAGPPRSLALAPTDGQAPIYAEDEALVAGQPTYALSDLFAPDQEGQGG